MSVKMDRVNTIQTMRAAIKQGDMAKVKSIIESDKDALNIITAFGTWLHVAASMGRMDILKYLIKCGLDIDVMSGTFNGGAINEAAGDGHYDIVEYLLSIGAKLDISEPERNPLFSAVYGGHKDIVRLLLDSGIDASVRYTGKYMDNMDAYAFAIERGQTEIAEMLKPYRK
jgi:uncharacterized protein